MVRNHEYVRHCEVPECGRLDLRERFPSLRAAKTAGVWQRPWECQECGGSEFVLLCHHRHHL